MLILQMRTTTCRVKWRVFNVFFQIHLKLILIPIIIS
jgi:hypothetical protein